MSDLNFIFHWKYVYDKSGNMICQTDAKGQTITFDYYVNGINCHYDGLNRPVQKTYQGEVPSHWVIDTYDKIQDCMGKLTKVCNYIGGVCEQEDRTVDCDLRQNPTATYKKIGSTGSRFY